MSVKNRVLTALESWAAVAWRLLVFTESGWVDEWVSELEDEWVSKPMRKCEFFISTCSPAALDGCFENTFVLLSKAVEDSENSAVVVVLSCPIWVGICVYERECQGWSLTVIWMPLFINAFLACELRTVSGSGVLAVSSTDESGEPVCASCMCARNT